ncbi:MAG: acyl--CoA ligase [Hyphomonas sp.]|nr:acyl--CoA ligase [Hyphomonas sp.]
MISSENTPTVSELIASGHANMADFIAANAWEIPTHTAIVMADREVSYAEFHDLVDRVAVGLQDDGFTVGDIAAIAAESSIEYLAAYMGVLRCGGAVAPLPVSVTPEAFALMVADCGASHVFTDGKFPDLINALAGENQPRIVFFGKPAGGADFGEWAGEQGCAPTPVSVGRDNWFNIIYSSGTTGTPKGIVQSHGMRWRHVSRGAAYLMDRSSVALASTPLYSNTTLVTVLPMLATGGTVILMPKFDALQFLQLCEKHQVTHAMLVPVQYRRILNLPEFDTFDLSAFKLKLCTSAAFSAELKAEVLERWPGGVIELYGMTEGGGSCMLAAHTYPDKLHTVGKPADGHDIRIIDENGQQLPPGATGEIVGRSSSMMEKYLNQPEKTRETEWIDPEGHRFIRTGDLGRFDDDGFLILSGRKKDMINSGGFNIYPSDLEAVLDEHESVLEVAVVGKTSEQWGETPVAYVVLKGGAALTPEDLRSWANNRLGKNQRISEVHFVQALPRSAIGKVQKRELGGRDRQISQA